MYFKVRIILTVSATQGLGIPRRLRTLLSRTVLTRISSGCLHPLDKCGYTTNCGRLQSGNGFVPDLHGFFFTESSLLIRPYFYKIGLKVVNPETAAVFDSPSWTGIGTRNDEPNWQYCSTNSPERASDYNSRPPLFRNLWFRRPDWWLHATVIFRFESFLIGIIQEDGVKMFNFQMVAGSQLLALFYAIQWGRLQIEVCIDWWYSQCVRYWRTVCWQCNKKWVLNSKL